MCFSFTFFCCDIVVCYDFEFISQYVEKNFLPGMYHVLNYSYVQFHTLSIYSKCCVSCGIECTVFFQLVSYNKLGIVTGFISKYNYTSFSEDCLSLQTV